MVREDMKSVIKYPGAKWSYAKWIVSFFPKHKFYLEPYFGSGAVLFNKLPAMFETINDIDGLVVNFFMVCRDCPDELARLVYFTPFSRDEFNSVQEDSAGQNIQLTGDCVEVARRFLIRCSQGFGSKLADRVGWKNTKHSSGPVNSDAWSKIPDTIYQVSDRLKNAQIENTDAVQLINACNGRDCLIYADPPYLSEVRNGKRIYRHEMMGADEHVHLLDALVAHTGPVVLSGYDNKLYNDKLCGWHKEQKLGRANSTAQRIETLWMNYDIQLRMLDSP
jgi:DNA adenine methylase